MIEPRADERVGRVGIGDRAAPVPTGHFLRAAFPHRLGEILVEERAEELKARRLAVLLAHEEERDGRGHEHETHRELHRLERHERAEPLALGPVADLIVVLQEDHEVVARQIAARRAARPTEIFGGLALIGKAFGDRAFQMLLGAEIDVIAHRLAGEPAVQRVVEVVRPHCVEAEAARARGQHQLAVVVVGFGDHVDPPAQARGFAPNRVGELGEDVHRARIVDRVDRVDTEAVDVELADPHAPVLDHVAAGAVGARAVVVHRRAPRGLRAIGEVRAELGQVVSLGAEMVVDDIEEHRQAARVAGVHETPEPARSAVGRLRRPEVHAVVTPVARAGKLGDRHQLHCGDAELDETGEVRNDRLEGAGRSERAHVQLVENEVAERVAREFLIGPHEAVGIDDDRRTVDALGLKP